MKFLKLSDLKLASSFTIIIIILMLFIMTICILFAIFSFVRIIDTHRE
jgi:hypothetical protein